MSTPKADAANFDPGHIAISKSRGISIAWTDGHRSEYTLRYLRDHCPCAACAGMRPDETGASSPFAMYKPALKIESAEPVGNYAIRIKWNDGHSTGIYSFEHFRRMCPCAECAG